MLWLRHITTYLIFSLGDFIWSLWRTIQIHHQTKVERNHGGTHGRMEGSINPASACWEGAVVCSHGDAWKTFAYAISVILGIYYFRCPKSLHVVSQASTSWVTCEINSLPSWQKWFQCWEASRPCANGLIFSQKRKERSSLHRIWSIASWWIELKTSGKLSMSFCSLSDAAPPDLRCHSTSPLQHGCIGISSQGLGSYCLDVGKIVEEKDDLNGSSCFPYHGFKRSRRVTMKLGFSGTGDNRVVLRHFCLVSWATSGCFESTDHGFWIQVNWPTRPYNYCMVSCTFALQRWGCLCIYLGEVSKAVVGESCNTHGSGQPCLNTCICWACGPMHHGNHPSMFLWEYLGTWCKTGGQHCLVMWTTERCRFALVAFNSACFGWSTLGCASRTASGLVNRFHTFATSFQRLPGKSHSEACDVCEHFGEEPCQIVSRVTGLWSWKPSELCRSGFSYWSRSAWWFRISVTLEHLWYFIHIPDIFAVHGDYMSWIQETFGEGILCVWYQDYRTPWNARGGNTSGQWCCCQWRSRRIPTTSLDYTCSFTSCCRCWSVPLWRVSVAGKTLWSASPQNWWSVATHGNCNRHHSPLCHCNTVPVMCRSSLPVSPSLPGAPIEGLLESGQHQKSEKEQPWQPQWPDVTIAYLRHPSSSIIIPSSFAHVSAFVRRHAAYRHLGWILVKPGQRETKPWLDSRNLSHATVSTPKMTDDLDGRILQIHFQDLSGISLYH